MNKDSDNLPKRDESLRLLINKGAEIAGGAAGPAVGTVIGSLLAGPNGRCCWRGHWGSRDYGC